MSEGVKSYPVGTRILRKPLFWGMIIILIEAKVAEYLIADLFPSSLLWLSTFNTLIQIFILYLAIHIAVITAKELG